MYTAGECRSVSNLEALVEQQIFPLPLSKRNAPVARPDTVTRSWHSLRGNYGQPAQARH